MARGYVEGPLETLIRDLAGLPAEIRRALRPALLRAARPILADAKRRASWSTRIPGAITLRTSFSQRDPGVRMVADAGKAPHARPFEHGSGRNLNLRHPLFGDRDRWFEEKPRPFFFPAVQAGASAVMAESNAAVMAAARAAGFR